VDNLDVILAEREWTIGLFRYDAFIDSSKKKFFDESYLPMKGKRNRDGHQDVGVTSLQTKISEKNHRLSNV